MKELTLEFNGKVGEFGLDGQINFPLEGICGLFGPSGSGKTSILRFISGLNSFKGKVIIGGDVYQDSSKGIFVPAHKRPIGYVFQDALLFSHLSVLENLSYALKYAENPFDLDEMIELFSLSSLLKRYPEKLSGGEKQRVALARSIIQRPSLLLLDEPLSSLDEVSKSEILEFLLDLKINFDIPMIYVGHLLNEILYLSDYSVVIENGRVVDHGTLCDLSFLLGNSLQNDGVLLKCDYMNYNEKLHLAEVSYRGELLYIPERKARERGEFLVKVMAEDVALSKFPVNESSVLNTLKGKIISIEDDNKFGVHVEVDCLGSVVRSRITRKSLHDLELRPNDIVYVQIKFTISRSYIFRT